MTRIRSRNDATTHRGYYYFGDSGVTNQGNTVSSTSYCEDVNDAPGIDHPFLSRKLRKGGVILNGSNGLTGVNHRKFENWTGTFEYPAGITLDDVNATTYATQFLARSNPSRPHVNLGLMIGEMRDLPRMFRLAGRSLIKKGASALLLYEFGWAPFFRDFANLGRMMQAAERRSAELSKLRETGGLKRRLILDRTTKSVITKDILLNSVGVTVRGDTNETVERTIWATGRWRPNPFTPLPDTDFERRLEMFGILTGTHGASIPLSVYDALPWSWLADWFANFGDFLQATNNSIAYPSGWVNVMAHYKTTKTYSVTTKGLWVSVATAQGLRESKLRFVSGAGLTASIPILSGRQLSILGALGINRMRGVF